MHQFTVEPLVPLNVGGVDLSFTNSSAWMLVTLAIIFAFMAMGMKRQVVPGRWQIAVEGLTGFIDNMVRVNIGPEGRKFTPYIFSLFTFILVANLLGLLPLAVIPGMHAFTTTSHFSITGALALRSAATVLPAGRPRAPPAAARGDPGQARLYDHQPFQHHRRARCDELCHCADRRLLAPRPALLLPVHPARHARRHGAADCRHRVHLVHGAAVQPGAATFRGDDCRPHSD